MVGSNHFLPIWNTVGMKFLFLMEKYRVYERNAFSYDHGLLDVLNCKDWFCRDWSSVHLLPTGCGRFPIWVRSRATKSCVSGTKLVWNASTWMSHTFFIFKRLLTVPVPLSVHSKHYSQRVALLLAVRPFAGN